MSRRSNGEGTVYRRKDGRWEGAAYFLTSEGRRKRVRVYGNTRAGTSTKLTLALAKSRQGIPVPDKAWTVGAYLDHWLATRVRPSRRPKTYGLYESTVRLHITPALGKGGLTRLSASQVQSCLNEALSSGRSVRTAHLIRSVLSAALGQAMREELVARNVARLVDLPAWERKDIRPWTAEEARRFLTATRAEPLYPAFLLLILYGLRRGEVLGLRWSDIDLPVQQIHVRQQIQRVGQILNAGPVKTRAGRRDLPLVPWAAEALRSRRQQQETSTAVNSDLVFSSRTGRPIEPGNFTRSFKRLCAQHDLPRITVHHLRHTTATLLKHAGVSARDAQLILGHAHVITTQQLYQHGDTEQQAIGIHELERLLLPVDDGRRCRQIQPSRPYSIARFTTFQSGGPSGTRTHDTLLKSFAPVAAVSSHLRKRLVRHVIRRHMNTGRPAVIVSCQCCDFYNHYCKTIPELVYLYLLGDGSGLRHGP
jgi:integrase